MTHIPHTYNNERMESGLFLRILEPHLVRRKLASSNIGFGPETSLYKKLPKGQNNVET